MKHLIFSLCIFFTINLSAQTSKFKPGLLINGFYRDKGTTNNPKVNKQLYVSPEFTYAIRNNFEIGGGLIYQNKLDKHMQQGIIYDEFQNQMYIKEWKGSKSYHFGTKFISRFNIDLNDKWSVLIGNDLGLYYGNNKTLADPNYPFYLNGDLVNVLKDTEVLSIVLSSYAGFKYQLNSKIALIGYTDLVNTSFQRERENNSSSRYAFNLIQSGAFDDAIFVKIGAGLTL